jgi:hypothetical protein
MAGPSSQKIPASGTEFGVAIANVGKHIMHKSTHTHVVIFVAFFFKFRSPFQILVDNCQYEVQSMCQNDKLPGFKFWYLLIPEFCTEIAINANSV